MKEQPNTDAGNEEAALLADLKVAGIQCNDIYELVNSRRSYKKAIPVLVEHLGRVSTPGLKEGIARALAVREAKGVAGPALVAAFDAVEQPAVRWAIGNALSIVATEAELSDLVRIATTEHYGKAREMVVVALGKVKADAAAVQALLQLLDDDEVAGHAVMALGLLKAPVCRARVAEFLEHPKPWVRKEAKRALAKIDG
ncbi:MAG: HEAT repeat domain-containing protein [Myxococcota bacterium]